MDSISENWVEFGTLPASVVLKAWEDSEFAKRLKHSPAQTLNEEGFEVPNDLKILIHDNSSSVRNFVLPSTLPELTDLSDIAEIASTKDCGSGNCD